MKLADLHKRRIAAELPVRNRVRLATAMREIEGAVLKFWSEMEAESAARWNEPESIDEDTIKWNPKTRHGQRGRIPGRALRDYVRNLVLIYERATGQQIGRRYDDYHSRELRHSFLVASLRAAGVPLYPRSIIQDVLHKLHPNAKRGRPKKGE